MADAQVAEPAAAEPAGPVATEAVSGHEPEGAAVEVQQAECPEVADQNVTGPSGQIDILLDTAIPVAVRLGEATFTVRELLQLAPGSVLKLDRQVGEPLDVFLRGVPFAKGQLVVVGEQLGIRLTEILQNNSNQ